MSDPLELSSYREQFNARARQRLNQHASVLRTDLINDATDIFRTLQALDARNRSQVMAGSIGVWVVGAEREAPMRGDQFRITKSFAVQNAAETERLKFHIPVPKTFDDDDPEAIMLFKRPDEIYTERIRRAGHVSITVVRNAITEAQTYVYKTVEDTQSEEQIGPEDVWAEFNREFDPGIDMTVGLHRDLVNWRAIQQRQLTVRPSGIVEL